MNYELMWMSLKHALVDKSHEEPDTSFYPAVILVMSGMEWYSQLHEEELEKAKEQ